MQVVRPDLANPSNLYATPSTLVSGGTVTYSLGGTAAAITTDGGQNIVAQNSSTTARAIYSLTNNFTYNDGIRQTLVVPPTSTATSASNFGAYLQCNVASTGQGQNCVNYFSLGIAAVNTASVWGINTACNDTTNNASTATSSRTCIGYEFDCTLATNNTGSKCQGITVIINGLFGEQSGGNAFQLSALGNSPAAHWTNGFVSDDGAVVSTGFGLILGALAKSGNSVNGQLIKLNRFDSGGTEHGETLQNSATGNLAWSGTSIVSAVFLATGSAFASGAGQISFGGSTVAAGASTGGGTCPTGTVGGAAVAGCVIVNVAGTQRGVPFF